MIDKKERHGRWITFDSQTAKCSCCGCLKRTTMYFLPDHISAFSDRYKFCTSCSARMDLRTPTEVDLDIVDSVMMGGADNAEKVL